MDAVASPIAANVEQTVTSTAPSLKIVPIERRAAETLSYRDFVHEYVDANRPVIITNAFPQWRALETWTPEFFKNNFGDKPVPVTYDSRRVLMGELIDAVNASTKEQPGPYLHKLIINQHMPELLPDITPGNMYGFPQRLCSPLMPGRYKRPDGYLKLLIGGVGGEFPLMHFDSDNANAMISEIYGLKEFVLFAPSDTPYVYPGPTPTSPVATVNNLDEPDLERFPLFIKATQHRGIIGPNEAAFIPSRWWHSARVVTTSISTCTNMIHRSTWPGFVNDVSSVAGSASSRLARKVYMTALGKVLDTTEALQSDERRGLMSIPNTRISTNP